MSLVWDLEEWSQRFKSSTNPLRNGIDVSDRTFFFHMNRYSDVLNAERDSSPLRYSTVASQRTTPVKAQLHLSIL